MSKIDNKKTNNIRIEREREAAARAKLPAPAAAAPPAPPAAATQPAPAEPTKRPRGKRLAPNLREAIKLDREASRIEKRGKSMARWSVSVGNIDAGECARACARDACEALRLAATALRSFPADWTQRGQRVDSDGSKATFVVGAFVAIRAKAATKYADAFSDGEGQHLKLAKLGAMCSCITDSGDRVFLPRRDLQLASSAASSEA